MLVIWRTTFAEMAQPVIIKMSNNNQHHSN